MVLTKGQREQLCAARHPRARARLQHSCGSVGGVLRRHAAVLEYLQSEGFEGAAAEFQREASVQKVSAAGTLEKKWSSVVRQQKKIGELEKKVADMAEELANGGGGGGGFGGGTGGKKGGDAVPALAPQFSKAGHRNPINAVAFHPNFSIVVSAAEDATVRVWDSESGEFEKALKGHTNSVSDVCFDKAGQVLASCSADFTVKLWDFADLSQCLCVKTLKGHEHTVSSVAFLPEPNGDKLVSASRDCTIRMWDTSSGYCTKTFKGHDQWVRRVLPNADGTALASCSDDQSIRLWDVATAKELEAQVMNGHENVIETLAWLNPAAMATVLASVDFEGQFPAAADGAAQTPPLLLSGSRDKTIRLWDGSNGTCLKVYVRPTLLHIAAKASSDTYIPPVQCRRGTTTGCGRFGWATSVEVFTAAQMTRASGYGI